ncbi:hypothetical protein GIW05_00500 [Pseudomonas syringae]|uniref:hypothetical protein n=1 Tax=Pseudomonas syringae TaxID=317 RepID=UPI001F388C73|nr:hypothetical protein [Pseudomonas syringae]MCF5382001.1 hypothetical protein [Pseudomonas syringae]MCF5419466.1 hypothetical protein [Pseudomonas syringae]MCF5452012.1 hypothetical protein [Pseudomonas syringae]MCF5456299.1 hypothetical protein [Pseudomonas syringae]
MVTCTQMLLYTEYNARMKAQGIMIIAFSCPSCDEIIETRPAPRRAIWGSMPYCHYCVLMFLKITEGKKAFVLNPDAQSKARAQFIVIQANTHLALK